MIGDDDFAARFEKLNDESLVEIAFGPDPDAYEHEAIAAALAELRKRRASANGLKETIVQNNRILEAEVTRAEAPNEWWRRIVTLFVAPTMIIPWVMAGRLEAKGYYKKARDTRWWWINGFLSWVAVIFLYNELF